MLVGSGGWTHGRCLRSATAFNIHKHKSPPDGNAPPFGPWPRSRPYHAVILLRDPVLGLDGPRAVVNGVDRDKVLILHGRDLANHRHVAHVPPVDRELVVARGRLRVVQLLDGQGAQGLVAVVVRGTLF